MEPNPPHLFVDSSVTPIIGAEIGVRSLSPDSRDDYFLITQTLVNNGVIDHYI